MKAFAVAALLLLAAGALAGCTQQDQATLSSAATALHSALTNTSFAGVERPSDAYCGKDSRPEGAGCVHEPVKGDPNSRADPPGLVELRGWVLGTPVCKESGTHGCFEYGAEILLDTSWDSSLDAGSGVTPIDTPDKVVHFLTPDDVLMFGQGSAGGSPQVDSDGLSFGGSQALVVHVEIVGWAADHAGKPNDRASAPSGWTEQTAFGEGPGVFWAYPPQRLWTGSTFVPWQQDAYVRLVGLGWEDEPHVSCNPDGAFGAGTCSGESSGTSGEAGDRSRINCWFGQTMWGIPAPSSTSKRGWMELHPPDYMVLLDAQKPRPKDTTMQFQTSLGTFPITFAKENAILSICADDQRSGDDASATLLIHPGPRPSATSQLACGALENGDFTVQASKNVIVTAETSPIPHCRVEAHMNGSNSFNAKLFALYVARWVP
ncbi:MAG: hypothetical protein QOE90_429 [Thermoplasmata archaeon]|nr:hypothetical protein [Thermoplasmata archaeon]